MFHNHLKWLSSSSFSDINQHAHLTSLQTESFCCSLTWYMFHNHLKWLSSSSFSDINQHAHLTSLQTTNHYLCVNAAHCAGEIVSLFVSKNTGLHLHLQILSLEISFLWKILTSKTWFFPLPVILFLVTKTISS